MHILYLESYLAIGVHIFGKLPCYRSQVCTYLESYLAIGVHILYLESYIAIGVHIFGKLPCYRCAHIWKVTGPFPFLSL